MIEIVLFSIYFQKVTTSSSSENIAANVVKNIHTNNLDVKEVT